MFKLWKTSPRHEAAENHEESSMQQPLQKRIYEQSSFGGTNSCDKTGLSTKETRETMSSMRKTMLPELLLLQNSSAGRDLLSVLATEFDKCPIVYISGPYSSDPINCVNNTLRIADKVLLKGGIPYIPHLTHYWETLSHKSWEFWIAYDLRILVAMKRVIMLRLEGKSQGADIETFVADRLGIKVLTMEDIKDERFDFRDVLEAV